MILKKAKATKNKVMFGQAGKTWNIVAYVDKDAKGTVEKLKEIDTETFLQ